MGGAQCTTADVEAYTAAKIKQQYEVQGASSFTEEQLNSLPLKKGWSWKLDEGSGRPYFYNRKTQESSWTPPLQQDKLVRIHTFINARSVI